MRGHGATPKRRWSTELRQPRTRPRRETPPAEAGQPLQAVHQFGLVGGDYDSKDQRLQQLLERLPVHGRTLVFASPQSQQSVQQCLERCRRLASRRKTARRDWTCTRCTLENSQDTDACSACGTSHAGASPEVRLVVSTPLTPLGSQWDEASCRLLVNYDFPRSGADYLRRLGALEHDEALSVVYTFVEDSQLRGRPCREVVALLRRAREAAPVHKAAELDSQLELLDFVEEEEEGEEGTEDEQSECDCAHCRGSILGSTSFHPLLGPAAPDSGVEVVRLPLRILEDFDRAVPFIAPRLPGHVCTLICLHCLNVHTPWDGWEQYFAPPELTSRLRVVLVLADGVSWHEYPDSALVGCGGASWVDLLDMDSMDRTDLLLERLVDHEAALLNGQSERIVLMGMSQGGGQSMLRFLRSPLRLGGWIGSVCHVPTAPHAPRHRDPLVVAGRPTVNRGRPVRLLAGECDSVFPSGLVLRDAARLRDVGGFTDVEVEVRPRLAHEGYLDEPKRTRADVLHRGVSGKGAATEGRTDAAAQRAKRLAKAERQQPDLIFAQRHLPSMVSFSSA